MSILNMCWAQEGCDATLLIEAEIKVFGDLSVCISSCLQLESSLGTNKLKITRGNGKEQSRGIDAL